MLIVLRPLHLSCSALFALVDKVSFTVLGIFDILKKIQ